MIDESKIVLRVGTRVILPADDELEVPAQRAEYLGEATFRIHPKDRLEDDWDGLVEVDPGIINGLEVIS